MSTEAGTGVPARTSVRTSDGVRLHVVEYGTGPLPCSTTFNSTPSDVRTRRPGCTGADMD